MKLISQDKILSSGTKTFVNNLKGINLPSPRLQWSVFSLSLIHIFATWSTMRADLFYGDGLYELVQPDISSSSESSSFDSDPESESLSLQQSLSSSSILITSKIVISKYL